MGFVPIVTEKNRNLISSLSFGYIIFSIFGIWQAKKINFVVCFDFYLLFLMMMSMFAYFCYHICFFFLRLSLQSLWLLRVTITTGIFLFLMLMCKASSRLVTDISHLWERCGNCGNVHLEGVSFQSHSIWRGRFPSLLPSFPLSLHWSSFPLTSPLLPFTWELLGGIIGKPLEMFSYNGSSFSSATHNSETSHNLQHWCLSETPVSLKFTAFYPLLSSTTILGILHCSLSE